MKLMASNPVALTIPANAKGIINSVSNAGWYQRLTLTWSGGSAVLQGSGEGQPMKTPDGKASLEFAPLPQGYQISATFEFSPSGPSGPFSRALVQNPIVTTNGPFTITQVTSEDSTDNDNNDTYLTVVAVNFPGSAAVVSSPAPAPAAAPHADAQPQAAFDGQLETHAKTYYSNPLVTGGDEQYFTVTSSSIAGVLGYQGQSWSGRNATYYDDQKPFGGYLSLYIQLYNCTHPGMHDHTLTMTSTISYWGGRPTGYRSANWDWQVGGSGEYTVTRVTE
jgi:hypothetical protein